MYGLVGSFRPGSSETVNREVTAVYFITQAAACGILIIKHFRCQYLKKTKADTF
jgi:hypothetical protein